MKFCMKCMTQYGDNFTVCPVCGFKEGTLPTDQRCMEPGNVLADRYIVGMPISIDSWFVKYIAWDALTNRRVIVNEFLPVRYAAREVGSISLNIVKQKNFYKYMSVILKKAQLLSETHIPDNICTVFESFERNNTAYIITEYIDGKPLGEYIKEKKPMEMKTVERLFLPILKSIDKLHENGFIFGGFSPDNFIVTDENSLIFCDYLGNIFYNVTESGTELKANPSDKYFPYERINAAETIELSPENDVFSAAMIMYEMLGAEIPDCHKRMEIFEQKHKDILKAPSKYGSKMEKSKENALINAAAVSLSYRTSNIETFIKELTGNKDVALLSKKKSKFPLWAKICIPVAAAAVIGTAVAVPLILNSAKPKPVDTLSEGQTVVPSIINYSLNDASAELQKRNLLIEIDGKTVDDNRDADTVLTQDINKGAIVSENTVIGVAVSAKSGEFSMPNFLGIRIDSCVDVLETIGINYTVTEEYNSNISENCVIRQSITPYSKVTAGQRVDIVISKGPEPAAPETSQPLQPSSAPEPTVSEPDTGYYPAETPSTVQQLTGQTYDEAVVQAPANTSPPVEVEERVFDDSKPEGTIIEQFPAPGEKASEDTPVKVVVSTANTTVIVPDITYLDQIRAEKLLKYYGFNSECEAESSDLVAEGLVISQEPAGGKEAAVGDTIKFTISKGKETFSMPDVIGKTKDEAAKTMTEAGLALTYTYEVDTSKEPFTITKQSITSGSDVKKGDVVILTVNANGEIVKVPDIIGKDISEADKIVTEAGLNLIIYADDDHPYTEGIVSAQGPKSGITVEKGSDMVVILSPAGSSTESVPEIRISARSVSMNVGQEYVLNIETANISDLSKVEYDIADKSVADVVHIDKDTLALTIKGISQGNTELRIYCGDMEQKCTIYINGGVNE